MPIFDQYDIEAPEMYSGSLGDQVYFGDVGTTAFSLNGNIRRVLSSRTNKNPSAYLNAAYMPYWIVDGFASGSFLGRNQKFVSIFDTDEIYYDSIVPNPIEIHNKTTENLSLLIGPFELTGAERWGMYPIDSAESVVGGGGIAHVWAIESGPELAPGITGSALDTNWGVRFPFETYYKNTQRLIGFNGVFTDRYSLNNKTTPTGSVTPASSSNKLATCGFGYNKIKPFDAGVVFFFGLFKKPEEYFLDISAHAGSVPKEVYFNAFYGFGDGDEKYGLYLKGPGFSGIEVSPGALYFAFRPLVRGFKYGIYSANQSRTGVSFRRNKYGNFRDMLEQRQQTAVLVKKNGTTSVSYPIDVSFVSGSDSFEKAKMYATASSATSFDPRDTGFYDYHYRAGQPFFDI